MMVRQDEVTGAAADREACRRLLEEGLYAALRVPGITDLLRADLEESVPDLMRGASGEFRDATDPDTAWWADVEALCARHQDAPLGFYARQVFDALRPGFGHGSPGRRTAEAVESMST